MKSRTAITGWIAAFGIVILLISPALAQDPGVETISGAGTIDWVGEKLTAVGHGAPVTRQVGPAQIRILARRAAVVVAQRNLLEVTKGVHIDSTTRLENFILKDDTVESKVEGVLKNFTIENVEYLSDGSAKATISIPLTGELRATLIQVAEQSGAASTGALPALQQRIDNLERRVRDLEQRIRTIQNASISRDEVMWLLSRFVEAWTEYQNQRPMLVQAQNTSGIPMAQLAQTVDRQEARLKQMSEQIGDILDRIRKLEHAGGGAPPPPAARSKTQVAYTGLVIDARRVGFRPCLKPGIFGPGAQIYPGAYINMDLAVRSGYVRYYRDLGMAQKSSRAGSLPLTIRATGTHQGNRNLAVGQADFNTLKAISEHPESFLGNCRVIVVF